MKSLSQVSQLVNISKEKLSYKPNSKMKNYNGHRLKGNPNHNQNRFEEIVKNLNKKYSIISSNKLIQEDILQAPIRKRMYDLIRKNSGININELERKLNIGANQVLWHLNFLEKSQLIKNVRIGNQKAYYNYYLDQTDLELFFYLRKEKINKIIELLKDKKAQSGLSPTIMSKQLNMHYNTLRKYLKILHEIGVIKYFVINKKKVYILDYYNYYKTLDVIKNYSKQVRSNIVQEFLLAF